MNSYPQITLGSWISILTWYSDGSWKGCYNLSHCMTPTWWSSKLFIYSSWRRCGIMTDKFLQHLTVHSNFYSTPIGAPAYNANFSISIVPPTWWRIKIFIAPVGDAIDRSNFYNLYIAPVGALASCWFTILWKIVPIVHFHSASIGATTSCKFPNLYSAPRRCSGIVPIAMLPHDKLICGIIPTSLLMLPPHRLIWRLMALSWSSDTSLWTPNL